MRRTTIHLISAVALSVPLLARAAPDPQVMALEQQIAALQLDHALALNPQQAQALLPVLQSGNAQLQGAAAQRQAAQPALVAALTQAVSDLQATGTISAATEQALAAARPAPPAGADLRALSQQVEQVLTSAQLEALRTAPLGVWPAPIEGRGGRPPFGHRNFRTMHVLFSDAFVSLVQARAG